jgi:8-oxo-dGTP pyrophosphatase MutT (NUDIX family)
MHQNYKIFIRNKPLIIASSAEGLNSLQYKQLQELSAKQTENIFYNMNDYSVYNGLLFIHENPEDKLNELRSNMKLIQAAGGLVWNENDELLMIYRRGKWDLPKGKIEEDETLETAAVREVEEECGIADIELLKPFTTSYYVYEDNNDLVLKETFWYEMLSKHVGEMQPQEIEGITEVVWVPKHKLSVKLSNSYPSIIEIVEKLLAK